MGDIMNDTDKVAIPTIAKANFKSAHRVVKILFQPKKTIDPDKVNNAKAIEKQIEKGRISYETLARLQLQKPSEGYTHFALGIRIGEYDYKMLSPKHELKLLDKSKKCSKVSENSIVAYNNRIPEAPEQLQDWGFVSDRTFFGFKSHELPWGTILEATKYQFEEDEGTYHICKLKGKFNVPMPQGGKKAAPKAKRTVSKVGLEIKKTPKPTDGSELGAVARQETSAGQVIAKALQRHALSVHVASLDVNLPEGEEEDEENDSFIADDIESSDEDIMDEDDAVEEFDSTPVQPEPAPPKASRKAEEIAPKESPAKRTKVVQETEEVVRPQKAVRKAEEVAPQAKRTKTNTLHSASRSFAFLSTIRTKIQEMESRRKATLLEIYNEKVGKLEEFCGEQLSLASFTSCRQQILGGLLPFLVQFVCESEYPSNSAVNMLNIAEDIHNTIPFFEAAEALIPKYHLLPSIEKLVADLRAKETEAHKLVEFVRTHSERLLATADAWLPDKAAVDFEEDTPENREVVVQQMKENPQLGKTFLAFYLHLDIVLNKASLPKVVVESDDLW